MQSWFWVSFFVKGVLEGIVTLKGKCVCRKVERIKTLRWWIRTRMRLFRPREGRSVVETIFRELWGSPNYNQYFPKRKTGSKASAHGYCVQMILFRCGLMTIEEWSLFDSCNIENGS